MLGKKYLKSNSKSKTILNNKSKTAFKTKSYSSKNIKRKSEDEEILSESENNMENISDDEFFEKGSNSDEDKGDSIVKESADTKRLRLARKLISNIEGKLKDENAEKEEESKKDLDDYLKEEMQKENNEYEVELYKKINPQHKIFLKGHHASVTCLDISSDSKTLISVGKDCRAIKWDLETNKKILLPQFTKRQLLNCIWAPDDKNAFFAGSDRHIYQLDVHNQILVQSFKAHNDTITGLAFDPNQEQYYSIGNDKKLNVWGVSPTQKSILLETFYGHINKINDLDLLITNKVVSCGSDHLINLWKIDTQSFLKFQSTDSFSSVIDNIKAINMNTFTTGSYDGTVTIWKTNKKKPQNKIANAHGYYKEYTPQHDFFHTDDNMLDMNHNIINNISNINGLNYESLNNVKIPYPICSLTAIRNSDIIFSGSLNGKINVYRFYEGNKIDFIKEIEVNSGCINSMKVNKTNEFMVVGYGKDQRLGRWFTDNKAKTGISIIKLFNE